MVCTAISEIKKTLFPRAEENGGNERRMLTDNAEHLRQYVVIYSYLMIQETMKVERGKDWVIWIKVKQILLEKDKSKNALVFFSKQGHETKTYFFRFVWIMSVLCFRIICFVFWSICFCKCLCYHDNYQ